MKKEWKIGQGCLKIPIQEGAEKERLVITLELRRIVDAYIPLSQTRIDFWAEIPFDEPEDALLLAEARAEKNWFAAICWEDAGDGGGELLRHPYFHCMAPSGEIKEVAGLYLSKGKWEMEGSYDPFGTEDGCEVKRMAPPGSSVYRRTGAVAPLYCGDVEESGLYEWGDKRAVAAKSNCFDWKGYPCRNMLSIPLLLTEGTKGEVLLKPVQSLKRCRIWKREWENAKKSSLFEALLQFCIVPDKWPNIKVARPQGKGEDITAEAFEIRLEMEAGEEQSIRLDICGWKCTWDCGESKLRSGEHFIGTGFRKLELAAYVDFGSIEIICGGHVLFLLKEDMEKEQSYVDNSVSGNLGACKLENGVVPKITAAADKASFKIRRLTVYGMRKPGYSGRQMPSMAKKKGSDTVFYESGNFIVYNDRVWDRSYGYPEAVAVSDGIVVSPLRVTEEFDWRKTPWGDMVRAVNREDAWYAADVLKKYPMLHTPVTALNAAYRIALDTFELCKSKKFALAGQEGLWSAGLFQGPGAGFGVWLRDSVHISLRGGNLVDPAAAGATLGYALLQGFDNGADGLAMGIAGIWDYYLATGEKTLLYECWPVLLANICEVDKRYDPVLHLIRAEQSTSNDAFPEPENGGYCLSTECYYAKAYEGMAKIGGLLGYEEQALQAWEKRGQEMKSIIRNRYWNEEFGYFTSGPRGSRAYERGYWETSGEEAAIWSRLGIATMAQKRSVLEKLDEAAMSEYGIRLFPYRTEKNHFCGTVWGVWQAGFAAAAAELGNSGLVLRLLAQQIRCCLMNKTFYEVIDADTGIAWRWPGQLWNAAGFISLLYYGVLGMEYDEEGLSFHPAVPEALRNLELERLPYRRALLAVRVIGHGTELGALCLDGTPCERILADLAGEHNIILEMKQK